MCDLKGYKKVPNLSKVKLRNFRFTKQWISTDFKLYMTNVLKLFLDYTQMSKTTEELFFRIQ